jgi:diguanylate cyclase (GGDEF)-like protein
MEYEKLDTIMQNVAPSLALNLSYGFSDAVLEIGNNLITHQDILHVKIIPLEGIPFTFFKNGVKKSDTNNAFVQTLDINDPVTAEMLAQLEVHYSKQHFTQLMNTFYTRFATAIAIFIITIILLILFLIKLLKPLGILATMMHNFNPKNPKKFPLIFSAKDEISSIGISANSMVSSVKNYLDTMQVLNKKLYQNEAHLKEAQRMAHVGSWEYNIVEDSLELSSEMYRILALNSNVTLPWNEFLAYINDDDIAYVIKTLHYAIENGSTFELKYTITLKNQKSVHIHTRGKVRKKESGEIKMSAVSMDVSTEYRSKKTIERLAFYDQLTQLPNRTLLNDRLSKALSNAKRHKTKLAILFLDLDHFKTINDTLGHDTGDALLIHVSKHLKRELRESDTIARIGGDEFVILLTDINSENDAIGVTKKLLLSLHGQHSIDQHLMYITTSIGVALYPDHAIEPSELLKYADTAMYEAKSSGRDNFMLFTKKMSSSISQRASLEHDLQTMERNYEQFEIYFQPKIDLHTNTIISVEALIRWNHPTRGLIFPDEFIYILESDGLILHVGEWIIESCIKQVAQWERESQPLPIAINLSAAQFQDDNLITLTASLLKKHNVNPSLIEFEITENISINNIEESLLIMQAIKSLGISLSVDDFGTGYSSLSYLKRFPIDVIKIDKSFVMEMHQDSDDLSIVKTIINMAQSLGFKTVAEGVENLEHVSLLKELGCNIAQGYFFAKPLRLPDFQAYQSNFNNTN